MSAEEKLAFFSLVRHNKVPEVEDKVRCAAWMVWVYLAWAYSKLLCSECAVRTCSEFVTEFVCRCERQRRE